MSANDPVYPIRGFTADASGALCGEYVSHVGLTKRELFAAMAMQGYCGHPSNDGGWAHSEIASEAVAQADALLAQLSKEPT